MFAQTPLRSFVLALALLGLALYAIFGGYYATELVVEIAVLGMLAISLDVVAGFGGMHSLFHGALMGLAGYGFGIGTVKFGLNPYVAVLIGLAASVAYGTLVGYVTSRTSGIFFIMATMAFGQMAYNVAFRTRWLGGDDGMTGLPILGLDWLGIDLGRPVPFALFSLAMVVLVYVLAAIILNTSFGRSLVGMQENEDRMNALGVDTRRIKTYAFAVSSFLAGIAGVIAAQHAKFVSPDMLIWTFSGEVLIVLILGGAGTLLGPLLGAICFVLLKHQVQKFTTHWPMVVGLVLIAVVLAGGRGLWGEIEARLSKVRAVPHA